MKDRPNERRGRKCNGYNIIVMARGTQWFWLGMGGHSVYSIRTLGYGIPYPGIVGK
jgi:hypothetical protein